MLQHDTGTAQRDGPPAVGRLLDVERFPQIRSAARASRSSGRERYRLTGELTIRDVSRRSLDVEYGGPRQGPLGQRTGRLHGQGRLRPQGTSASGEPGPRTGACCERSRRDRPRGASGQAAAAKAGLNQLQPPRTEENRVMLADQIQQEPATRAHDHLPHAGDTGGPSRAHEPLRLGQLISPSCSRSFQLRRAGATYADGARLESHSGIATVTGRAGGRGPLR